MTDILNQQVPEIYQIESFQTLRVLNYVALVLFSCIINIVESTLLQVWKLFSTQEVKVQFTMNTFVCISFHRLLWLKECHFFYSWNLAHLIAAVQIVTHSVSAINNRWQTSSKSAPTIYFLQCQLQGQCAMAEVSHQ